MNVYEFASENWCGFVLQLQWRPMVLPDCYIDHGSPADQLKAAGLTPSHIAATVFNLLGQTREALEVMTWKKCKGFGFNFWFPQCKKYHDSPSVIQGCLYKNNTHGRCIRKVFIG